MEIELPSEFDGIEDQVFVVGGWVRDRVLGKESDDVDLMAAGVSVEEMESRGFTRVDATAFPVFLDSRKREVALPRLERSEGDGHNDFEMQVIDPDVPVNDAVERDLERRDLTINAMAMNASTGELFDPFGGREDAEKGVVRHVSEAFREDPLRVVRAARFAARFDFEIAPETQKLMHEISHKIRELPEERFGKELVKALRQSKDPRRFFEVLHDVGALRAAFPEVHQLTLVPAGPGEHHKEGSAFEHTMLVLEEMHDLRGNDVEALLAALGHDLGKIATPVEDLPSHFGHGDRGEDIASDMRDRLGLSRDFRGVMRVASGEHMRLHLINEMGESSLVDLAERVDDSPVSVDLMADLQAADALGRDPEGEVLDDVVREELGEAVQVVNEIGGTEALENRGLSQRHIGEEVPGERVGNMVKQDRVEEVRSRLS